MMADFLHWKTLLLDALFPPICGVCNGLLGVERERGICSRCLAIFTIPEALTCPECRGRIPRPAEGLPPLRLTCHPKAGYLLLACSFYDDPAASPLIQRLKFERRAGTAAALGEIAARALGRTADAKALLIPLPLSAKRLRERGFNQSELIAEHVSRRTGIRHEANLLRRIKNTTPQTMLKSWQERKENISGVFQCTNPDAVGGRTIILVDDVWTSGATMNDAVRALREAGAGRILGLVISRTR